LTELIFLIQVFSLGVAALGLDVNLLWGLWEVISILLWFYL